MIRILLGSLLALTALPSAAQRIDFNRDIRPILSANCFACHGPDNNKRQAGLRLDQKDVALARGAIVAGRPDKSKLIERILAADARRMPPSASGKVLTQTQKDLLVRWIKEGAEYQQHWAYIPPRRPPVPGMPPRAGTPPPPHILRAFESLRGNPIDAFVQAKLAEKKLFPSAEAERRTLIRRVYLDLIGIPPTPKEVAAFLSDRSPIAYEKVVDRLLASPHYGERMAAHWLDIVRYADTVGYHGDQNMNAWAYRDYVIDSFNKNKPFDRFTIEQIAGDLLPNANTETRTATCFNRLNMVTREGGAQPKEYLAKYAADRVRTVSMAWLGSTMGCCECHNHKYDPFSAKDFYSLAAFFADVKQWGVYQDYDYTPNPDLRGWSNDHPFPPEITVESPYLKTRIGRLHEQIRRIAAQTDAILTRDPAARKSFEDWCKAGAKYLYSHPTDFEIPADMTALGADGTKADGTARQNDGSWLIASSAPDDLALSLRPSIERVAAVHIELLTHAANGGSILRGGTSASPAISFAILHADGKTQPVNIRWASADALEPRYYNGFDMQGIQNGWTIPASKLKENVHSFWIPDTPVQLAANDRLHVRFSGAKLGCVKVDVSPLAPYDPWTGKIEPELMSALANPSDPARRPAVLEAYLRSTGWQPELFGQIKSFDNDIVECRGGMTKVMVAESVAPMTMRVLPRGNWQDESGEIVQPAVPHFLPQLILPKNRRLTRLDLANWLVSPENPLTARMFVNRLWKQFFGAALSDKVEDLGTQGEVPANPELLDWLACEFMKPVAQAATHPSPLTPHPWDIKHIVRLIVTSHTYRQSSMFRPDARKVDPENRLLASQNPRRLEAEIVRDNALAISGLINRDMGGPPCHPYQPAGYYVNLQFPDRDYIPEKDDRQWRRGVYMHWQRTFMNPMLANFDAPSREDCIAARTLANTPQQALTLLNDTAFVEAARMFAYRLHNTEGTDAQRIQRAYELALCRPPKPAESKSLLAFLSRMRSGYRSRPEDSKKLITIGFAPVPDMGDPVELAAWISVCRVILNLHETITRY